MNVHKGNTTDPQVLKVVRRRAHPERSAGFVNIQCMILFPFSFLLPFWTLCCSCFPLHENEAMPCVRKRPTCDVVCSPERQSSAALAEPASARCLAGFPKVPRVHDTTSGSCRNLWCEVTPSHPQHPLRCPNPSFSTRDL